MDYMNNSEDSKKASFPWVSFLDTTLTQNYPELSFSKKLFHFILNTILTHYCSFFVTY
jgi:hypothetical protein